MTWPLCEAHFALASWRVALPRRFGLTPQPVVPNGTRPFLFKRENAQHRTLNAQRSSRTGLTER